MAQSGKEGLRPNLPADVLRYWQALLRQEEALAVRPKARRAISRRSASPVGSPTAGQDYTKLPFDGNESFLLLNTDRLQVAINSELSDFFEDWLSKYYRSGGDDARLEYLVSFPTLLLPRDELAGLLRFSVSIQWKSGDKDFASPTPKQRAQGQLPAPPDRLELLGGGLADEDALPYFVDTRLLRDVLRIDVERLDAFFVSVRERPHSAPEFISTVCELLTSQLREENEKIDAFPQRAAESPQPMPNLSSVSDTPAQARFPEMLSRLHALVDRRLKSLASRARAFPVALLLDASRNRTTFHVQRDLQTGLTGFEQGQFLPADPLATYLSGRVPIAQAASVRRELVVGRFRGPPLTHSQRTAAELFWGSKFAAVQGPPGTGKTHLILNLAASELVQNFSPLQRIKQPRPDILLVTSTNNRAVDNVVRPLGQELPSSELPWALRVGSREVIEKVTQAELLRAKNWLERQPEVTEGELKRALHDFTEAEQRAFTRLSALKAEHDAQNRISELQQALAAMPSALPPVETGAVAESLRQVGLALASAEMGALDDLLQCLRELSQRLRTLSDLAEASQGTSPKHLAQHYKVTRDRQISRLEKLLGQPLELGLPPALGQKCSSHVAREAWEDAAERALGLVLALKEALEGPAKQQQQLRERERLSQELRRLVEQAAASEQPARNQVDWAASDQEQVELLEAAVRLREVWARENKKALVAALGHAAQACARLRSLRSVLEGSKGPGVWLRRLYPIWGCTLLSIGNNFSPERDLIRRVVIDEAGQCHGAYAVSALIRAESALIIGDVHQLEPVVELSQADESRVLRNLKLKSSVRELGPFRVYQGSDTSAQSIADRAVALRPTLSDHFRCQREIAALCDELCGYGLVTHTPHVSHRLLVPELCHSLLFSDVAGNQERFSGSWVNQEELASVTRWIRRLLSAGLLPEQIGVITPFRGQLERLWRELRAAKIPLERPAVSEDLEQLNLLGSGNNGVAVGTVHRFQGGERSVILFSSTITQARSLPFVDERPNLVNVAASRAKEHLITVGHANTLRAGKYTQVLVQRAKPAFVGG